jgi:hypothetical protein
VPVVDPSVREAVADHLGHRLGILVAVELGLSNSKLEGLNSETRLINHSGCGHDSAAAVIAMIYLYRGGDHRVATHGKERRTNSFELRRGRSH